MHWGPAWSDSDCCQAEAPLLGGVLPRLSASLCKPDLPCPLFSRATTALFSAPGIQGANLPFHQLKILRTWTIRRQVFLPASRSTTGLWLIWILLGYPLRSLWAKRVPVTGVSSSRSLHRFGINFRLSNSDPTSEGKNWVHQTQPQCLVRLGYIWQVAWYPRGRHSWQTYPLGSSSWLCTHTIGLVIIIQSLLPQILCVLHISGDLL